MIELITKISKWDYFKALLRISYKAPILIIITLVGLTNIATFVMSQVSDHFDFVSAPVSVLIAGLVFTLGLPCFMFYVVDRQYKRNGATNEVKWQVSDKGLKLGINGSGTSCNWSQIHKITRAGDFLVVYFSQINFALIPVSVFARNEDYSRFLEWAAQHNKIR